jgi:PAS domain S-box-containing protein
MGTHSCVRQGGDDAGGAAMNSPRENLLSMLYATRSLTQKVRRRPGSGLSEIMAYVLVFAVAAASIAVFLRWHIVSHYEAEMASWQARQSSVADDQAQRVSDWLKERQRDARGLAASPAVRAYLQARAAGKHLPQAPAAAPPETLAVLDDMVKWYSYSGVYLLDRNAQVAIESNQSTPLNPLFIDFCRSAARSDGSSVALVGDSPLLTQVGFMVPVDIEPDRNASAPPPDHLLGMVLVVSDASKTLFPLVLREVVSTRTGETILVRRDGNDMVYFSPLRLMPSLARQLRFPSAAAPASARLALEGKVTFGSFIDYRGDPVLGATQYIPLAGWGLVRKIDRAEALEDFRQSAVMELLAGSFLMILVGGLMLFHRRDMIMRALKQDEKKFKALLESPPDVMVVVNRSGGIVFVNSATERMFGYKLEEMLGKSYQIIIPERFRAESAEYYTRLLSHPELHGQMVQREILCLRKDGSEFPAEINSSPIETLKGAVMAVSIRDITQRKLAEAENARLAQIVNSSEDAILSITRDGLIATMNGGAERMYGYPAAEVKGKHFSLFIPEGQRSDLAANEERLFRGEPLVHYEMENVRKDGSKLQVSVTLSPIRDSAGEVTAVSVVARDITDRKKAEEAVARSEERYRSLYEDAPVGLYQTTPDGRILAGNPAFVRMLGFSSFQELAKRDLNTSGFEPDYPRSQFMDLMEKQGEVTGMEAQWHKRDGSVLHVRENARAIRDDSGRILFYEGTAEDITHRVQAEAEHIRLVTAIEQSAEAVVITNTQGVIEYVNPAFTRITGYSREEALGQNPRILKAEQQDPAFYEQLWSTILKGQPWHGELVNRRKDGSQYTEQMNIAPVRGAHGQVTHFIATKQDVTERRTLEEQLQQAAKIEAVGRLAGGVAHDFNNLLTIINGYSELLRDELVNDPTLSAYVEEIHNAGERAAGLTRQLLAFSRRQVLDPQVLDLNAVISNLEKMLRRLIGEDITLRTFLASSLGRVKADPGQIEQVIMNLAVNARDAMPLGGNLTIETSNFELDEGLTHHLATMRPGPHVMVAVSDTGVGMNSETKDHIFEPFFTTKEKGKGTGLGLATVYGIVKQSEGSIWVYSEVGHGTVFKIYLPTVSEGQALVASPGAVADRALATETILVVEDEDGVRSLIRLELASFGYNVLDTDDGAKALAICENHDGPIHLLVTDVVMPQMSGPVVADKVAMIRPDIKILYMSGYTDDAIIHHGVLTQEMPFIQKPFSPVALRRKIREVLGQS